jgi:DNA-binding transcriptional LysR family regulator
MTRFLDRIGGGRPFNTVEMGTNETIKQAVMAGLGIAIISAHTCHSELAEGKLALLQAEGLPLVRQWFLIHRPDRELTKAAEVLRRFIIGHKGEILP